MKQKVFIVHWRGPFASAEVDQLLESSVLYLATGRLAGERKSTIQYFGITDQSISQRTKRHHKLSQITKDRQIWIGWVMHPQTNRVNLETVERLLIYLWQPQLNERKKVSLPNPTSLLCHWFDPKWNALPTKPKTLKDLYDVICWDGTYWHTAQLDHWKNY